MEGLRLPRQGTPRGSAATGVALRLVGIRAGRGLPMKRLSVETMGDEVQGVRLKGDRRNPEPTYFRVCFPGGDVDVVRTTDDEYWVHVRVNVPGRMVTEDGVVGKLVDARLDIDGKNAAEA